MERVVILGRAGAGKTTLARRIGALTGSTVITLDSIWQPDWGPADVLRFKELLRDAHAGDHWVSDGNFAVASFDVRLPRATLIVWLDPLVLTCYWRAVTRILHKGQAHRPAGLWKVLTYIHRFDRVNRPLIEVQRITHGASVPVLTLRTKTDVDRFLAGLTA